MTLKLRRPPTWLSPRQLRSRAALNRFADRAHQLLPGRLLLHVGLGAGIECVADERPVLLHREHDHCGAGRNPSESLIASMLEPPGMFRSRTRASGRCERTSRNAPGTSAASASTSKSGSASRSIRRPVRMTLWSSASTSEMLRSGAWLGTDSLSGAGKPRSEIPKLASALIGYVPMPAIPPTADG